MARMDYSDVNMDYSDVNMDYSDVNYIFLSTNKKTHNKKCAYCGNKYTYDEEHIEYKSGNKTFCCYDHKMKYIRKEKEKCGQ